MENPVVHGPADVAHLLEGSSTYVKSEGSIRVADASALASASLDSHVKQEDTVAGDSTAFSSAPLNRRAPIPASGTGAAFVGPSALISGADLARYSHADASRVREQRGLVEFRVVWNNGLPEHMIALIGAKDIFAAQLPNMPKEYVTRHVLDRNHRTLVLITERGVIGGICFRPFFSQRFAEIVFCAITSSEQVKGYGSRIMNHLKEHVKTEGIEFFLTYADNYATEYFRKQGFTKHLSMPVERWKGWIKDYDGSTLMECKINRRVNYLDLHGMVAAQREAVFARIKQVSNTHAVFPGLSFEGREGRPFDISEIPGVLEAGWQSPAGAGDGAAAATGAAAAIPAGARDEHGMPLVELIARLGAVLKGIKALKDSWPFSKPVDGSVVTDYYALITEPMDLAEMTRRMNSGYYTSRARFERDIGLVVDNCRRYNSPLTTYYRCADAVETAYRKLMAQQFDAASAGAGGDADVELKDDAGAATGAGVGAGAAVGAGTGAASAATAGVQSTEVEVKEEEEEEEEEEDLPMQD